MRGETGNQICTERLHLFTPNVYIEIRADIYGGAASLELKQAICVVVEQTEILQQKLVLEADGTAKYAYCGKKSYIFDVNEKRNTGRGMDIWNGELVHFYIDDEEGKLTLTIVAHHLAGDGLAIVFLLERIMQALVGEKIAFLPLAVFGEEDFPAGSRMHFFERHYLEKLNRKWLADRQIFTKTDWVRVMERYAKSTHCELYTCTLRGEELMQILSRARELNISVNTLITTAALKAYDRKAVTGMAVSVRKKGDKKIYNAVSGISIDACYHTGRSFEENAKHVQK